MLSDNVHCFRFPFLRRAMAQRFDMSDLVKNSSDSEMSVPGAPAAATRTACRQCSEPLDIDDNFCRYCGGMTDVGAALVKIGRLPPPPSLAVPVKPPSWTDSPWFLLGLFVFFPPLVLPLLWRSRRFTRVWKTGLTCVVVLATAAALWYSVYVLQKAFEPLQELWRSGLL